MSAAWATISNGLKKEDVAILWTVWVAALMEMLALGSAMLRLSNEIRPSDRSLGQRAEAALSWAYNLRTLPERVRTLAAQAYSNWIKVHKERPAHPASGRTTTTSQSSGKFGSDRELWTDSVAMEAGVSGATISDTIAAFIQKHGTVRAETTVDAKDFAKFPSIHAALVTTAVLVEGKNGLAVSAKWREWVAFLFDEHRRHRPKASSESAKLRAVS